MPDYIEINRESRAEEPDRYGAVPHPREMLVYHGAPDQERLLLEAYRGGRMHHGWLFGGPEGVGKAVLAYRFARFLFAHPDPSSEAVRKATDLAVAQDHPVAGQVARQAYPDLAVIRRSPTRDGKSLRTEISVDDVRDGLSVFRTTSAGAGWRVAIVDSADELNRNSQNALLKMLEEPPARSLFILIAHRPGGLLPTIRSRCRMLRFEPLAQAAVAEVVRAVAGVDAAAAQEAAETADGSVRLALKRLDADEKALRGATIRILDGAGTGKAMQTLADGLTGKANTQAFRSFLDLVETRLRAGIQSGGEGRALAARAELWEKLRRSAREVETYNLDRRPFILSVLSELAEIERRPR